MSAIAGDWSQQNNNNGGNWLRETVRRPRRVLTMSSILFVLVVALYPWPFGILLALGMPFGPVYFLVYVAWIGLAGSLLWIISARGETATSAWPHETAMKLFLVLTLVWLAITNFFPHLVGPALAWFVASALGVAFLVEFAFVMRSRLTGGVTRQ